MNLGQHCLLDALLDPTISLVTCFGAAGTGKTLLAVAAASLCVRPGLLRDDHQPSSGSDGRLCRLSSRGLEEKMRPWLQPIYDAFDYLSPAGGAAKKGGKQPNPQER